MRVKQKVYYRYNRRCKWKEGRIHDIDYSRGLPFGIEYYYEDSYWGKGWSYDFRVNINNIKLKKKEKL